MLVGASAIVVDSSGEASAGSRTLSLSWSVEFGEWCEGRQDHGPILRPRGQRQRGPSSARTGSGRREVVGRFDRETIECRHTMDEHSLGRHWPVLVSRLAKAGLAVVVGQAPLTAAPSSAEDRRDRLARGDRERPAEGVEDLGGGVDPQGPEHGRGDVVGRDGVGRGIGADPVAGPVDRARGDRRRRRTGRCSIGQWSRPSGPNCVVLVTFGERPNSPIQTIRVSSSSPRAARSSIRVGTAWSVIGQQAVLELVEVVAVRVPAADSPCRRSSRSSRPSRTARPPRPAAGPAGSSGRRSSGRRRRGARAARARGRRPA